MAKERGHARAIRRIHNWKPGKTLNLSRCYLTELPPLPPGLTRLFCERNRLTHLPDDLPDTLKFIDCSFNNLTCLPSTLPRDLDQLYCVNNRIRSLPLRFPPRLRILYCSDNLLTCLPPSLPPSLEYLCTYSDIIPPRHVGESLEKYHRRLTVSPIALPCWIRQAKEEAWNRRSAAVALWAIYW